MSKAGRTNLILLSVLIVLLSIFFTHKNQAPVASKLTALSIDDIHTIRIVKTDDKDIIIQKTTDASAQPQWMMLQPYSHPAHDFRIQTLLSLAEYEVDRTYDTAGLSLADYGLEPPRAQLYLNDTHIAFGKTSAVNHKRYLHVASELFLLEDKIFPLVSARASSLLSLEILPSDSEIISLDLPSIKIRKLDTIHWQRIPDALSIDTMHQLLQHWKTAQAYAVHPYLTRQNTQKIQLVTEQQTYDFELYRDDSNFILALPATGIEYHLQATHGARLLGKPDA